MHYAQQLLLQPRLNTYLQCWFVYAGVPNALFTEDTLRMLIHNLLTGDNR